MAALVIPDELLEHATDEELFAYVEALRQEILDLEEWKLQPRQERAEGLVRGADGFIELLYGGAAGGGKSDWLLWHFYHLAQEFPGSRWLLMRRTFKELRRSLIVRSWQKFDRSLGRYYATDHEWRFHNGSVIEFGYCESDEDVYIYQSAEYAGIGWDELTQYPTEFPYTYLLSRIRVTVAQAAMGLVPHCIAGTNPGNVGGGWVKSRFVDIGPPEVVHQVEIEIEGEDEPRLVQRAFVPAKLSDNRYIDAGQYRLALANLPKAIRLALEDGSWDVVEGQYFTEWDRRVHVIAPFDLPEFWSRARGYDFGYAKPMCCLWGAWDGDGNLYIYRELYGPGMLPEEQAKRIVGMTRRKGVREKVLYTVADPSIWARTGAGPPIADQLRDAGLPTRKANNARIDGWVRLRQYLKIDRATKRPKVFIFATCANLIRTLPMLVHDKDNPEDLDTDGEDHAADAFRYLVMSRPPPSRQKPKEPDTVEARIAARHKRRRRDSVLEDTPVGTV